MASRRDDPARFDAAYYERFYERSAVHDADSIGHLAAGVHHLAAWWGIEIRSVLDIGAGTGLWRDWYRANHPHVTVTSVDVSEYACRTYGHDRRDIASWRPSRPADLVICHGVVHYLDDERAERAIENIAAATGHLAYLEIPTRRDLTHVVDQAATDMDVYRRDAGWYRTRLTPRMRQAGAGLWVRRDSVAMYDLEAAGR